MTKKDFREAFQIGKCVGKSNLFCNIDVYQYACEAWDTMTEKEREETTVEKMVAYVEDTMEYVNETSTDAA